MMMQGINMIGSCSWPIGICITIITMILSAAGIAVPTVCNNITSVYSDVVSSISVLQELITWIGEMINLVYPC